VTSDGEQSFYVEGERDWQTILSADGVLKLEGLLPAYLQRQRWFGGKSRNIVRAKIDDSLLFDENRSALVWVTVEYDGGDPDTWLLCLAMSFGAEAEALRDSAPHQILALAGSAALSGVLHDGMLRPGAPAALLEILAGGTELPTRQGSRHGSLRGLPGAALSVLRGPQPLAPRPAGAEQSNSSAIFGDRLILKLFRRQQPGPNPDVEIGRFLTETAKFSHIPPFAGSMEYRRDGQEPTTLALLQGLVPNEGDGWQWTLEELDRYYESAASARSLPAALPESGDAIAPEAREHAGMFLEAAAMLGRRTAEMHLALAAGRDAAFAPQIPSPQDLETLRSALAAHAARAFDALKSNLSRLPDDAIESAALALSRRGALLGKFAALTQFHGVGQWIRIHGDYHLGQVLRTRGDFVILDFEGEPARSLEERRAKHSPLRDVAGMLRSFSYAAFAALTHYISRRPADLARLEPWARLWESSVSAEFLRAWRETAAASPIIPAAREHCDALLDIYMLDKALYELMYELNNRPAWIRIPLHGILSLPT
jgi:maltose alpha-D-glucosyltransferase/alpha-amylase